LCYNLEKIGYLEKTEKGRRITVSGRKYVDGFANKIQKELAK
jgi:ribosomal protein S19E (S16A)